MRLNPSPKETIVRMPEPMTLRPDRWLICSPYVSAAINGPWRDELTGQSLASFRLRSGQIEDIPLSAAASRAGELLRQGAGTVHVVLERHDGLQHELERQLGALAPDVLLYHWRHSPLQVMASLNSPEHAMSQAWSARRHMPQDFTVAGIWPANWREQYLAALTEWAAAAKDQMRWEFAAQFEDVPVVSSLTALLESLAASIAGADSATTGEVVQMQSPRPGATQPDAVPGLSARAATTPSSRTWPLAEGVALTLSATSDGDEVEVLLILATRRRLARRIAQARAWIGDEILVEFSGDDECISWQDENPWMTTARAVVPYAADLEKAAADLSTPVNVACLSRTIADETDRSAANDANYDFFPFRRQQANAGSAPDEQVAMEEVSGDTRLTLSFSRRDEDTTTLIFRVNREAAPRYLGRTVWVRAGSRVESLGAIFADGAAIARFQGHFDLTQVEVAILIPDKE